MNLAAMLMLANKSAVTKAKTIEKPRKREAVSREEHIRNVRAATLQKYKDTIMKFDGIASSAQIASILGYNTTSICGALKLLQQNTNCIHHVGYIKHKRNGRDTYIWEWIENGNKSRFNTREYKDKYCPDSICFAVKKETS